MADGDCKWAAVGRQRRVHRLVDVLLHNDVIPRKRNLDRPLYTAPTERAADHPRVSGSRLFWLHEFVRQLLVLRATADCGGGRRTLRWPGTRSCAGNWPLPGRARSGSLTQPGPGRCCAATATPGSLPPGAVRTATRAPGTRGAGAAWCQCAGITARSGSTGGCWRSRWRAAAPAGGPPRPGHPLPARAGPVGDPRLRRGTAVRGRNRRGACRAYPSGQGPDPARTAGVDIGIIHPYAVVGPERKGLLVSGRAIRAECRQHLRDRKGRSRPPPPERPSPDSVGRADGASTAGPRRESLPGTCAGSAKLSTRPPKRSSAGPWSSGSAPSRSATRAAC